MRAFVVIVLGLILTASADEGLKCITKDCTGVKDVPNFNDGFLSATDDGFSSGSPGQADDKRFDIAHESLKNNGIIYVVKDLFDDGLFSKFKEKLINSRPSSNFKTKEEISNSKSESNVGPGSSFKPVVGSSIFNPDVDATGIGLTFLGSLLKTSSDSKDNDKINDEFAGDGFLDASDGFIDDGLVGEIFDKSESKEDFIKEENLDLKPDDLFEDFDDSSPDGFIGLDDFPNVEVSDSKDMDDSSKSSDLEVSKVSKSKEDDKTSMDHAVTPGGIPVPSDPVSILNPKPAEDVVKSIASASVSPSHSVIEKLKPAGNVKIAVVKRKLEVQGKKSSASIAPIYSNPGVTFLGSGTKTLENKQRNNKPIVVVRSSTLRKNQESTTDVTVIKGQATYIIDTLPNLAKTDTKSTCKLSPANELSLGSSNVAIESNNNAVSFWGPLGNGIGLDTSKDNGNRKYVISGINLVDNTFAGVAINPVEGNYRVPSFRETIDYPVVRTPLIDNRIKTNNWNYSSPLVLPQNLEFTMPQQHNYNTRMALPVPHTNQQTGNVLSDAALISSYGFQRNSIINDVPGTYKAPMPATGRVLGVQLNQDNMYQYRQRKPNSIPDISKFDSSKNYSPFSSASMSVLPEVYGFHRTFEYLNFNKNKAMKSGIGFGSFNVGDQLLNGKFIPPKKQTVLMSPVDNLITKRGPTTLLNSKLPKYTEGPWIDGFYGFGLQGRLPYSYSMSGDNAVLLQTLMDVQKSMGNGAANGFHHTIKGPYKTAFPGDLPTNMKGKMLLPIDNNLCTCRRSCLMAEVSMGKCPYCRKCNLVQCCRDVTNKYRINNKYMY